MRTYKLSELAGKSFGCCGSHQLCEMGRKKCVHVDDDPDYAMLCTVYLRQQGLRYPPIKGLEESNVKPASHSNEDVQEPIKPVAEVIPSLSEKRKEFDEVNKIDANGQLLLF